MGNRNSSLRAFLDGCKEGMQLFGHNIALIINTGLLLLVYLIGVGFTSIAAMIAKKHFLEMKKKKGAQESYWKDLGLKKKPLEEYYRQF